MNRTRSRMGGIFALAGVFLLAAIVAGITFEQAGRSRDARRFPQVGESFDIGGRSLNLYCTGEGSPTVILLSGAPMPGYSWVFVEREIAKFTRACWYDRAGYGWSDPGPYPRDSTASAADLDALLRAAGVAPPYVLVGASFAGLDARVYQRLHPREVAGMVLVDAMQEDEFVRMAEVRGNAAPFLPLIGSARGLTARAANMVGLLRLLGRSAPPQPRPKELTAGEWETIQGLRMEPKTRTALMQEAIEASCAQARAAGNLGDLPLIVLSSPGPPVRMELQGQLVRLSSRGRQAIVEQAGGSIPLYAPAAVIQAVRTQVSR